jgi:hypothetical protein
MVRRLQSLFNGGACIYESQLKSRSCTKTDKTLCVETDKQGSLLMIWPRRSRNGPYGGPERIIPMEIVKDAMKIANATGNTKNTVVGNCGRNKEAVVERVGFFWKANFTVKSPVVAERVACRRRQRVAICHLGGKLSMVAFRSALMSEILPARARTVF